VARRYHRHRPAQTNEKLIPSSSSCYTCRAPFIPAKPVLPALSLIEGPVLPVLHSLLSLAKQEARSKGPPILQPNSSHKSRNKIYPPSVWRVYPPILNFKSLFCFSVAEQLDRRKNLKNCSQKFTSRTVSVFALKAICKMATLKPKQWLPFLLNPR